MSISEIRKNLEQQEQLTKKGLKLSTRCGSCMFLNAKCPALEAPCVELGKTEASQACNFFEGDYSKTRTGTPEVVMEIGRLLRDLPEGTKHLIAYAIANGTQMERATFQQLGYPIQLGQPIMVNLSAPRVDFYNCWFKAYALGVSRNKQFFFALAMIHGKQVQLQLMLTDESIMSMTAWKSHREMLKKKKRMNADNTGLNSLLPKASPAQVTQEVEQAPAQLVKKHSVSSKEIRGKTKLADPLNTTLKIEGKVGKRVITL